MKNRFKIGIYHIEKRDFFSRFYIHKFKYALFPKDNAVTSTIIKGIQYEPYIFEFLVKNKIDLIGCDIVDVGANNGNFTIDFALLVGDEGRVFAFEPQRLIYYQLCGNVFMNGLDNVFCENVALSDSNGELEIQIPDYNYDGQVNFGDVRVGNISGKKGIVNAKRLDEYDFKDLKFIKIDVQGFETYVLKGAEKTIKKHRPYIVFEVEEEYLHLNYTSKKELFDTIDMMGYQTFQFQKGIPYQTSSGECIDWIAIPKEQLLNEFYIP